ncbi:hypothetical protein ERO13_A06G027400v2 [Gossypium hirsutum]|uniref:Epidermal patterning factor-like protein n=1 Tax=Gossypium hirsutum TaxID=3635 RepID=A0A1U8LT15_GOSHI|nr:EPIDERMAL PATTERNING FACTOR-like protein 2 [Gossypium hirsutum]KAG4193976.1 hypothetical protein ERO13_A06G027400v2 [Gossypium hirsutum]
MTKMNSSSSNKHRHFIISLLFLMATFMAAQGRSLSIKVANEIGNEPDKALMMRNLIGSRPPKCQKRCSSCPQCEAIQVPITTRSVQNTAIVIFPIAYSKGNDMSNYKPMCWKCKCGNMIFNP